MLGAIIGDMYGSIYEFDENNVKDKRLVYFTKYSLPTDDTIMTIAVSKALLEFMDTKILAGNEEKFKERLIYWMNEYGEKFPDAGYGSRFNKWLHSGIKVPYNSYGNGSAMRVSPVGWYCESLEDTLEIAKLTAEVTHNHPEGIKGAQAVASAIYLLRTGKTKEDVKDYIEKTFGYDLSRKLDDIREGYTFHVSCQKSVPEAIIAFLESTSYEDALKNAISIGGDSDTIACIAGALAECVYEIPLDLRMKAAHNVFELVPLLNHRDMYFYDNVVDYKKATSQPSFF